MNRQNLKNFLTQNYLKGRTNVYKIKSPNGQHYVLVNKNSFIKLLLGRNNSNIVNINQMIYKSRPYVARKKSTRRNESITWGSNNYNNYMPTSNYVFRVWNNNYGMRTVRGPYGPIKLTNVNHYKLTPGNLGNLRVLRRQNTKNAAEFARQQAAKTAAGTAERRKYIYRVRYPSIHNKRSLTTNILNPNLTIVPFPKNAEPITTPNQTSNMHLTNFKRKFQERMMLYFPEGNYNFSRVSIYPYKLKN
jgi:hypothetical protein